MSRLNPSLFLSLAAGALTLLSVVAQAQAAEGKPPQRVRSVTLQGNQACPTSTGDEIVVCTHNDEPYRIPKGLRDSGPIAAQNQSWVNRAAQIDDVSRTAGGLPDTCSPVGSGGQTGCSMMWNRNWAAERRAIQQQEQAGR